MTRMTVQTENNSDKIAEYSLEKIQKALGDKHACYVLITCGAPTPSGEMSVEMSYGGDEVLASYLLEEAQWLFDKRSINMSLNS